MNLNRTIKNTLASIALATGLGACATAKMSVCTIAGVTRYTAEYENADISFYTSRLVESPLGAIEIASEDCAVALTNKEEGEWFALIDDDCDGTVDTYFSLSAKKEQSTSFKKGNEEYFTKTLDPIFKGIKEKATGGKLK